MALRALVLDDSRSVRGVLARIFFKLGFEAVQACNGVEALATMDREGKTIQLILADWNMPGMNGLEFLKRLRTQPDFTTIPFIMVTTETSLDQMAEALSFGADEYLMKPFTTEMLEAKLRIMQVTSH